MATGLPSDSALGLRPLRLRMRGSRPITNLVTISIYQASNKETRNFLNGIMRSGSLEQRPLPELLPTEPKTRHFNFLFSLPPTRQSILRHHTPVDTPSMIKESPFMLRLH